MKLALDPENPVPLYRQIAEAIRYRIATGRLMPGQTLPPLREAATLWGVNRHTVQRTYAELARDGLVQMNGALGTRILEQYSAKLLSKHDLIRLTSIPDCNSFHRVFRVWLSLASVL